MILNSGPLGYFSKLWLKMWRTFKGSFVPRKSKLVNQGPLISIVPPPLLRTSSIYSCMRGTFLRISGSIPTTGHTVITVFLCSLQWRTRRKHRAATSISTYPTTAIEDGSGSSSASSPPQMYTSRKRSYTSKLPILHLSLFHFFFFNRKQSGFSIRVMEFEDNYMNSRADFVRLYRVTTLSSVFL